MSKMTPRIGPGRGHASCELLMSEPYEPSNSLADVTSDAAVPAEDDLPEQMRIRRDKRDVLVSRGMEPYAIGLPITTTIADVRAAYPDLPVDTATGDKLWETKLKASVEMTPVTYRGTDGRQFVTVVDTGGSQIGSTVTNDEIIAFALPK